MTPLLLRAAVVLALAYAGISLYVFFRQREMLYHPAKATEQEMTVQAGLEGLDRWQDGAGHPLGWVTRQGDGSTPVLLLHGNAGNALDRSDLIARLREVGVASTIHIVDYPGYGSASGSPNEASLTAAAVAALDALPRPVVVIGESLGTGVASQAVIQRPDRVVSLLLITPFDSMTNAAWHHYPWLPVPLLLRDRFDSVKALSAWKKPTAILIGGTDQTTPPAGARALFRSLPGPKQLFEVPTAGHNDAAFELSPDEWEKLWTFLRAGVN